MRAPVTPLPADRVWPTFRRLLGYTGRYWWVLAAGILGYIVYGISNPLIARFMEFLTDFIARPDKSMTMVVLICLAPAAFTLLQGVSQFVGGYCLAWVGQHIVFDVRNEVFRHILRLPQRVHAENASGRLTSRIVFDAQQITAAGTDAVNVLLREGFSVIALLAYLMYQNWKLTLILFTVGPAIGMVVSATSKRFRKLSRRIQASMGDITQQLGQAFEGIREVKVFGGTAQEEARFERVSRRFERANVKLVVTKILSNVLVQLVVAVFIGLMVFLYIRLMGDAITVGEFVGFLTGVGLIQKPLKQLNEVNVKIQRGVTGAASLFEVLDQELERDTGERELERARGELSFRDVHFHYTPDKPVLRGLSFDVRAGETVALVGRSGAGKSTVANLLPRFYDPVAGEILLDGVPLAAYRLRDLRRQISFVSQKVVLFDDTVRANIAYGDMAGASDERILAAARDAHAMEFIEQLEHGLDTPVGQDGIQLSGGQRQRIAIARALLKDAPILILDEATSALDNESEYRIQQALERLMKGRTTLVIAHRLSTIENADRILVLDQGRLVEGGSHAELLARDGYYTQLYRMNFAD